LKDLFKITFIMMEFVSHGLIATSPPPLRLKRWRFRTYSCAKDQSQNFMAFKSSLATHLHLTFLLSFNFHPKNQGKTWPPLPTQAPFKFWMSSTSTLFLPSRPRFSRSRFSMCLLANNNTSALLTFFSVPPESFLL
jgi:hypothetical protein